MRGAMGEGAQLSKDRRDREQERLKRDVDRLVREEEEKRAAETERRGEELREAWRRHHPQEGRDEHDRPKKSGLS